MKILYIAPSTLPSRAANAVHVALQCQALAEEGAEVTLVARRSVPDAQALPDLLRETYGLSLAQKQLKTLYTPKDIGSSFLIAFLALRTYLAASPKPDMILSRNLYASFLLGVVLGRPLLFETHQLETGWRKGLQRRIMTRPHIKTVVISEKLAECLTEHHGVQPTRPVILHDAAPCGDPPLPAAGRRQALLTLFPDCAGDWRAVCGYFGHLYAGRGLEIIESMAAARPDSLFLVFGGNEADIRRCREASQLPNLRYMGYLPHAQAQKAMRCVDVLLMPYQESVSIGVAGHDTSRWMSPMKMFEYMAAGVPLISSDLPVLREVLEPRRNALLTPPAKPEGWIAALDELIAQPDFAHGLAACAYNDFIANHTWAQRAKRLMAAATGA